MSTYEEILEEVRRRLRDSELVLTVDTAAGFARQVIDDYQRRSVATPGAKHLTDVEGLFVRVLDALVGWGDLSDLISDPNIEEIHVLGDAVWGWDHRTGRPRPGKATTEAASLEVVMRMLEDTPVSLDLSEPTAKAIVMGEQWRLSVSIPPSSRRLMAILRRFHTDYRTLRELVTLDTLSTHAASFLWAVMQQLDSRVVVSGMPGSGKTTLLAAMHRVGVVPTWHRIRILEPTYELILDHPQAVNLQEVPHTDPALDLTAQIEFSLTTSPTRLLVGEILGKEAQALHRAANAGVGLGVTVHSNSATDGLHALVINATKGTDTIPLATAEAAFARDLDYVIHMESEHLPGAISRYVTEIVAVLHDQRTNRFRIRPLFSRATPGGDLIWTGKLPDATSVARIDKALLAQGLTVEGILRGEVTASIFEQ